MQHASDKGIPLCVDLDGTLLRTDSTWEAIVLLVKTKPHLLFVLPLWLLSGKSALKEKIAASAAVDITMLPYHETLLEFLRDEQKKGRRLVLVTGSTSSIARAVAGHLGIFDEVFATSTGVNLTGRTKANLLVDRFGEKGFDYIGNARIDLKVWEKARKAIVVNAAPGVQRTARKLGGVEREFHDKESVFLAFFRAIRPYQWTKNILILVPIVTAHRLGDDAVLRQAMLAFISFCFCTSSVYLLNDLLDLTSDRLHPRKRFRPLASGQLPIPIALASIPLLLIASLLLALTLPPLFTLVLLAYFLTTLAYSFYLKQFVLIDVLVLAGLYSIRIIAGHSATGIVYSWWLLMFAMFFFFSLALMKRSSELERTTQEGSKTIAGRGYGVKDREIVSMLGSASGLISILILTLYMTSDQVVLLYARPQLLWLVVPVMLFWMSRIWLLAQRGVVHDDPIIFTLKDSVSYMAGVIIALLLFFATGSSA